MGLVNRLPTMPDTVNRLLVPGRSPTETRTELLRLAAGDPGLCSELLYLANTCSAAAGTVSSVAQALDLVGVDAIIQMVAVSSLRDGISEQFAPLEHLGEYFLHSRRIACGCRLLAEVCGLPPGECELYAIGGLIHDVGRLVILMAADQTGAHLMGTSLQDMLTIVDSEKQILGLDHCEVGHQICSRWSFSPRLQEGVLRHHTPFVDSDFSYPGALFLMAHFVAESDFTGAILHGLLPPELFDRLALDNRGFDHARRHCQRRQQATGAASRGSRSHAH